MTIPNHLKEQLNTQFVPFILLVLNLVFPLLRFYPLIVHLWPGRKGSLWYPYKYKCFYKMVTPSFSHVYHFLESNQMKIINKPKRHILAWQILLPYKAITYIFFNFQNFCRTQTIWQRVFLLFRMMMITYVFVLQNITLVISLNPIAE